MLIEREGTGAARAEAGGVVEGRVVESEPGDPLAGELTLRIVKGGAVNNGERLLDVVIPLGRLALRWITARLASSKPWRWIGGGTSDWGALGREKLVLTGIAEGTRPQLEFARTSVGSGAGDETTTSGTAVGACGGAGDSERMDRSPPYIEYTSETVSWLAWPLNEPDEVLAINPPYGPSSASE